MNHAKKPQKILRLFLYVQLSAQLGIHLFPVDKPEPCIDIILSAALPVEIISVLPYITAQQRPQIINIGRILINGSAYP